MNPSSEPNRWYEKPGVIGALLALMAVLLISQSWNAPFYPFDDHAHIYLAVEEPWLPRTEQKSKAYDSWHPLLYLEFVATVSYRIDYALFGAPRPAAPITPATTAAPGEELIKTYPAPSNAWAPAVRLMNAVYHALAGFLLWLLLRRLRVSSGVAAFVALVWTGHPMACESVCWIAERKNVLSALFGFGALLAWMAPGTKSWRWPLVGVLYLLALFSKPTALGLLPLFAVLEIADPLEQSFDFRSVKAWLRVALRLALPAAMSLAVVLLSVYGIQQEIVLPPGGTPWTAVLTDAEICLRYISHLLLPVNLSFFYAVDPIISPGDPRFWVCGTAVVAIFAALIYLSGPQRRVALIGVLWFIVVLGPSWNLIAIPYFLQDRYAYLASAGFLLAVGLAADGVLSRLRVPRSAVLALAGIELAFLAGLTVWRSADFRDEATLVFDAVKKQPRSAIARRIATSLIKPEYEKHTALGPEPNPELEGQLRALLLEQYEGALKCPDMENFFEPFYLRVSIAELLVRQGRFAEARARLDGWLPPKDMTVLPENAVAARGARHSYMPQTLAYAWLVMAEASLRESFRGELSAAQREKKCTQALNEADQSIAAHRFDFKGTVVKARTFIRLSELHAENAAVSHQEIGQARSLLESVPDTSERAGVAHYLLQQLPTR